MQLCLSTGSAIAMRKGWNKRPEPLLNTTRPVGGLPALASRTARRGATAAAAWWLSKRGWDALFASVEVLIC